MIFDNFGTRKNIRRDITDIPSSIVARVAHRQLERIVTKKAEQNLQNR